MEKIKKCIPNVITISRIISSIIAPIMFLSGNILPAFGMYTYGAISDFFDGLAARKLNATTKLGKILDPISDKLYALSLLAPSILLGNIIMIIPLFFEAKISLLSYKAQKEGYQLETERVGKYKTWYLFITILLGLLSTIKPELIFITALFISETAIMQNKSLKIYEKQLKEQKQKITRKKIEIPQKQNLKSKIKTYYNELAFYRTFPIETNDKPKVLKRTRNKLKKY